MRFSSLLLMCFLFIGCVDEPLSIRNMSGNQIAVIGHRGCGPRSASNPIPENTLASVQKALELYGAAGVELDVQMSKDGVFFLYHDDYLETQTNFSGCVAQYTAQELAACKYRNSDVHLQPLHDIFNYCKQLDFVPYIMLDNKLDLPCNISSFQAYSDYLIIYAQRMYTLIQAYGLIEKVHLESDFEVFHDMVRQLDGDVKRMFNGAVAERIDLADSLQCTGIMSGLNSCTAEDVQRAHARGLKVSLFGVFNAEDAENAISKSPDFIITDDIPVTQDLLN